MEGYLKLKGWGKNMLENVLKELLMFAFAVGVFVNETRSLKKDIKRLEEKQDKHNSLIERMAIVEQSTKSAHHRIDEMKEKK